MVEAGELLHLASVPQLFDGATRLTGSLAIAYEPDRFCDYGTAAARGLSGRCAVAWDGVQLSGETATAAVELSTITGSAAPTTLAAAAAAADRAATVSAGAAPRPTAAATRPPRCDVLRAVQRLDGSRSPLQLMVRGCELPSRSPLSFPHLYRTVGGDTDFEAVVRLVGGSRLASSAAGLLV